MMTAYMEKRFPASTRWFFLCFSPERRSWESALVSVLRYERKSFLFYGFKEVKIKKPLLGKRRGKRRTLEMVPVLSQLGMSKGNPPSGQGRFLKELQASFSRRVPFGELTGLPRPSEFGKGLVALPSVFASMSCIVGNLRYFVSSGHLY